MKQTLLGLCLVLLALDCSSDQQSGANPDADVAAAKSAIKEFAGALQMELKGAMKAGGPVAAIGVCNTQAMPITARVSADRGMILSRVSLKNRNQANVANDWQSAVLEDFEQKKLVGKDITKLAWSETVKVGDGQEFRFMKAIPTGEVCLKCHGTQIAPEVSQVLASLYPEDRATGYKEGDIRGAFVVTRKLPN
jgi:hypothetical protein